MLKLLHILLLWWLDRESGLVGSAGPTKRPLLARILGKPAPEQTEETPQGQTDEQKAMRAEYLDERKGLVESEQKYAESFDKIALTIISGALVLSVGFVKDLAPHPVPWSLGLLIGGWFVLVGGLLGSMLGLYWSQQAFKNQICIRDDQFRYDSGLSTELELWWNPFTDRVEKTNLFVIGSIVLGVTLVLSFAGVNFVLKTLDSSTMDKSPKPTSDHVQPKPGASAPPAGRPVPITSNGSKPAPPSSGGKKK